MEYVIRSMKGNREGFALNGIKLLLVYADEMTLLGDSEEVLVSDTDILLNSAKDIDIEVYIEKPKYIITNR